MKAHNGGRWGGAKHIIVGDLNDITADLTSTTIDISTASETPAAGSYLVDRYKGASIYMEGDSDGPYTIASNDANGVCTLEGTFSQAVQDADGTGSIDGEFRIVVPHQKELAVVIGQDSATSELFSLVAKRKFTETSDWETVSSYDDLGLSSNDDKPWLTTILEQEEELRLYQLEVSSSYTGATVEAKLPANFCEIPTDVSGATLTFQWYRWSADSTNTGDPFLGDITAVDTSFIEPHVYTVDFTAATTFDVTVTWPDGTSQALGSGTVGTTFAPAHPQLTTFTIEAGGTAAVDGDQLTVRVDPLPLDLYKREAFVYPVAVSADGNNNQRIRIVSNTYNSITVRSDLVLTSFGAVAAVAPSVTTGDLSAVSFSGSETIILTPDSGDAVTLTISGAVGPGAAAIKAELDTLDTDSLFTFTVSGDTIIISVNGSYGSQSTITLGNGTGHGDLSIATSGTVTGTDGVPARVEARMPMWGGYDGDTPAAADYIVAMDLSENRFNRWFDTNLGLVRFATVGITATTVKDAARPLAAKHGWKYMAEFASSLESQALPGEAALADMIANEEESDYVDHIFPSRVKYLNVAKTKTVTRSPVGQFMGIKARLANAGVDGERGFHIAAANNNLQGKLSPRCKGLSDDLGRWTPPKKLLNDHGVVMILWEGPNVYLWGNRMYSKGRTPKGKRYTITERDVYYHVARDLFVTTRPFFFKSISARRLGDVSRALREKMKVYYHDGWFSDEGGRAPGFEQQCSVQVPLSLNTAAELNEGNVYASVTFTPRPALESLTIVLSPTQTTATDS
jgi:hypothetical protein